MTGYLLDTNIVSTLRRPDRIAPDILKRLHALPGDASFVSVMTIMEIEQGILLCQRRDPKQSDILREWFTAYRNALRPGLVLPITEDVAMACAAISIPNPRPRNDALIGATALVHDLTLVTRNVADFASIAGCRILDPWAA
ncbi:twitching motility protein PilT [Aureimonas endophytica]|uniref:Twitching motility protein PilT n=1 Tax=Aureimonas endophytica TaxID=2027858 RepID=A0A916ZIP5_9HYPH|nr:type II toxin-antitoxin system VapC family toxin [Aureimonas endophytica]GGD99826.1 twitching motility protein PilT [Aureimonas endophytica]